MKKNYLFFSLFFLAFLLISCFQETVKRISVEKVSSKEVSNINFTTALDKYGVPESIERFDNSGEKGSVFPGMRAEIGNFFPIGSKKTEILEAVWKSNDSMNIAVWYTKKQNKWIPFDHFEYGKDWDF
ncbi:hypothetical protein [Chryseobacterium luquanense]|uniref:Lipoprotein n=1 Tax=Chryseobacterium luquanense TaxID=2983766 RepID=A0ABT3Y831_9FLAO|nr:hypothetical protein [Chryseobacterium luquanense]MCX8534322.1 hypothetical protein [Chryseobacterium luquanense]